MSFLCRTNMFRSSSLAARALRVAPSPVSRFQVRFATQDYGSGDGSPVGEKPQEQGKNPKSHMEHPGPDAPNVGSGTSSSSSESSSTSSSSSSTSPSNSGKSSGGREDGDHSSPSGDHKTNSKGETVKTEGPGKSGAKPKILQESTPVEESESTKKHNEEMDSRHDKTSNQIGKK